MGKIAKPIISQIGNYKVWVNLTNHCALMLLNNDTPGMLGIIGTALGKNNCNIANMTLSRMDGGTALSVFELDSIPTGEVVNELKNLNAVEGVKVVDLS
jgi:D-3-phosphoglycerate dehydrogenase